MVWEALAGPAAGAALSYLGGKEGDEQRRRAQEEADRIRQQALAEIANIPLPVLQQLQLEDPEYLGDLGPQLAGLQYDSAMEGVSADPRFQQAQIDALNQLAEVGEGGMTAQDKFNMQQIQQKQAVEDRARQQAILQNMAERGAGGSGQELAARLQAQQSGANAAAMQGAMVGANAQQRALDAMIQRGELSGAMRSQDFGEQSAKAQAKDIASRFNTELMAKGLQRDAGVRQQMEVDRAGRRGDESRYNIQLPQQQFSNQMEKGKAKAGILGGGASTAEQRGIDEAKRTEGRWGNIAQGVSGGISKWLED